MSLRSRMLAGYVKQSLDLPWKSRQGRVVPELLGVMLCGGTVELDAAVLYADVANSSFLASAFDPRIGGRAFRCFLGVCARLISMHSGKVTAFDGDRVMGVFVGVRKETEAVLCALEINHMVSTVIAPALNERSRLLKASQFTLSHAVGIDAGVVFAVRAGYAGRNDLVWVGRPPNLAAKLSDIRIAAYRTFATPEILSRCSGDVLLDAAGEPLWVPIDYPWLGQQIPIHATAASKEP